MTTLTGCSDKNDELAYERTNIIAKILYIKININSLKEKKNIYIISIFIFL